MITDLDVAVASRDGTRLRVNCYRPVSDGPVPVLLCAHPYGKDRLPRRIGRAFTRFVPVPRHAPARACQLLDLDELGGA
jgi:predicted acyl esterase